MISDADRITHMLDAIAKMRISLAGMSKAEFLASDDKKAVAERYIMIVGEAAHYGLYRLSWAKTARRRI